MSAGTGREGNPRDGDVIEMDVEVRDGRVLVTRMDLRCCEAGRRAALEIAALARGSAPADAARVAPRTLIERLSLAPDEERCALTAIAALRAALVDAHVKELA